MGLLFPRLRIHQVFGANTDVGKTIITTALVRAAALQSNIQKDHHRPTVFYLKPVSTGLPEDADDLHVRRFTRNCGKLVQTSCLFKFNEPVSPHLAARFSSTENTEIPSDNTLMDRISKSIHDSASLLTPSLESAMFIETAGGVHSPTPSGTTQADAYRPLRLPTILVGDSRLGGISATISAYESLLLRGYDVESVLLFKDDYYKNWEYLKGWFEKRRRSTVGNTVQVHTISSPPSKHVDHSTDTESLERYYEEITSLSNTENQLSTVLSHLDVSHHNRLSDLRSMPRRTLDSVWWPFVQHGLLAGEPDVTVINSAHGDFFDVFSQNDDDSSNRSQLKPVFDGSASWWTQSLGHSNNDLTLAAAYAAGRYGHVIFPQATHEPALSLSERLLQGPGKGWASKVFFSDNGSTGMEVALKMAIRATKLRYKSPHSTELGVIGLKGSYHGDTIGAMDACESGVFNAAVEWHQERGFWFDVPTVGVRRGRVVISTEALNLKRSPKVVEFDSLSNIYNIEARLDGLLAQEYHHYIRQELEKQISQGRAFGALVIEPLLMGAGGMIFVDPLFHRVLVDVIRSSTDLFLDASTAPATSIRNAAGAWEGLPVIFDEVFVGLYRLGLETSSSILGVKPDILVLAKILTGGLVPLSTTLASACIFDAFYGDKKVEALLHGHSYTAYPIGCAVANESINLLEKMKHSGLWESARKRWENTSAEEESPSPKIWSFWDPQFLREISNLDVVDEAMALGTVLAIRLHEHAGVSGYQSTSGQDILAPIRTAFGESDPGSGIHFRTLGHVVYLMSSLNTQESTFRLLERRLLDVLRRT